jgi:hypothetical protein
MKPPKLSELLQKINNAVENPHFPGISKLELDLLKQHVRDFYEQLDTLSAQAAPGNNIITAIIETTTTEVVADIPVAIKKNVIKPNDDLFIKDVVLEQKAQAPLKVEITAPVIEEAKPLQKELVAEVKPIVTAPAKTETKVEKTSIANSTTINGSFKTQGSLNEKLKTASGTEIHKKLAVKPLKELIDLNKRFVLVNEFFKGNNDAYTAAITHIDTLPDYDAAFEFVSNELAWDESKQSTRMLSKLIRIKFGVE